MRLDRRATAAPAAAAPQAIVYALALTPWAVTRNFVAFVRGNQGTGGSELSALALQDANGVGDPSGSGEFFSFVPDAASRGLNVRPKLATGSADDPNAGAAKDMHGKVIKEGTERDLRALTQVQMAQMRESSSRACLRSLMRRRVGGSSLTSRAPSFPLSPSQQSRTTACPWRASARSRAGSAWA